MISDNSHIAIRDLEKSYLPYHRRTVPVLRGVNLSILKGETLAVLGASGVGKSTLLHILGALDRPTKGHVFFNNLDLFTLNETELARFRNRKVGFVFQFHHLLPEFNALDNTIIPGLIAGISRREATEKATAVLEKVGLKDRLLHKPGELSGGEQQRVAVARALVMDPEILLADEPTGDLDERTGENIVALLLGLNDERDLTTIIVTHNQALANSMKRRVSIVEGVIEELA